MFFLKPSKQTLRLSGFSLASLWIGLAVGKGSTRGSLNEPRSFRRVYRAGEGKKWIRLGVVRLAMALGCFCLASPEAWGQWRDDFEAGPTRWKLWRDDAGARVLQNQRITTAPHSGLSSEMMEVSSGLQGTYIYLFYQLEERLAVIDELQCRLWVRAAASGMRPAFRVVFPQTAHPATNEPLMTLLVGTPTLGGGRWSDVGVSGVVELLEAQRRILRAQYGAAVDLRTAYVDGIVLDVYNGPGNTKVQIDDLSIDGMVAAEFTPREQLVASERPSTLESEQEVANWIAERTRDIRASVPRWLQYRGESLDWVASLGMTGIVVDQTPTRALLDEAARLSLAVNAPPPNVLPPEEDLPSWSAIQSWSLGWTLDQSHLEATREATARLQQIPRALRRPTLVEVMEAYGPFGRLADILAVPVPLPTTLRDHDEAEMLLKSRVEALRGRTLPLTSILLEPIDRWRLQRDRIASAIGSSGNRIEGYDLGQARLHLMRSIGHGSRGWYFRSQSPLDSGESIDAVRMESLKALNAELRLLAPWIQSGEPATKIPVDLNSGYVGYRIAMPRSQLVMFMVRGDSDQLVIPSSNLSELQFSLPRTQQTTQVYRITRGRLESLATQPTPEGWSLRLPNPASVELLVVTEDPRAIRYLQSTLAEIALTICESRLSIAEQSMQLAQMTLVSEQVSDRDADWNDVSTAQSSLRGAEQFLVRGELDKSIANADLATALCDRVIHKSWQRARVKFPTATSTPLIASRLSLPLHWELDRAIQTRTWEPVLVPEGDFVDLNRSFASGWTIDRRLEDRVETGASIRENVGPDGSSSLLLEAAAIDRSPLPGGYAGASLLVSSPTMSVPQESLVHLEGLVRVVEGGAEPQCGLLVYDNEGGPALGQLVNLQTGNANTWQRIHLYRLATTADGIRFHFELRGGAKVLIDALRAEYLMPNPRSPYETRPFDERE